MHELHFFSYSAMERHLEMQLKKKSDWMESRKIQCS